MRPTATSAGSGTAWPEGRSAIRVVDFAPIEDSAAQPVGELVAEIGQHIRAPWCETYRAVARAVPIGSSNATRPARPAPGNAVAEVV